MYVTNPETKATVVVRDRLDSLGVEITPEMLRAGAAVLRVWAAYERECVSPERALQEVYSAMLDASMQREQSSATRR